MNLALADIVIFFVRLYVEVVNMFRFYSIEKFDCKIIGLEVLVCDDIVAYKHRLTVDMVKKLPLLSRYNFGAGAISKHNNGITVVVISKFAAALPENELTALIYREIIRPTGVLTEKNVWAANRLGMESNNLVAHVRWYETVVSLMKKERDAVISHWYLRLLQEKQIKSYGESASIGYFIDLIEKQMMTYANRETF